MSLTEHRTFRSQSFGTLCFSAVPMRLIGTVLPTVEDEDLRQSSKRGLSIQLHVRTARDGSLSQRHVFVVSLIGRRPTQQKIFRLRIQVLRDGAGAVVVELVIVPSHQPRKPGMHPLEIAIGLVQGMPISIQRQRRDLRTQMQPGRFLGGLPFVDVVSQVGHEIEVNGLAGRDSEAKRFLVKATLSKDKIEGSLQDITERVKATDRLRFLAEHDPLTSILNRRGIEKVLEEAIESLGDRNPVALAYLDLDRFKLINDLFGHVAGDEVLKQVCDRIREMLTDGQDIGRVGGDEFVIVYRGTTIQSATWTCRGIIDRIATAPYLIGDRAFQVKGSIGLIEVDEGMRVKDVISVADRACREAKGGHHANLVVFKKNSSIFIEREEELRMVDRLGASSAPEGLFLMMQPIMSMRAPFESLNFEILLRMREPDGSTTPATKIISAAESNGRISVIDRWVLSNTLNWLSTHYEHLRNTRFVCVNLSGGSLNDEKFVQDAFSMLSQYGRSVERLCIEITESVALHDLENTRRFIDKVRSFGAKIALDDFGAGYTSFSYLKELPADTVKIDGAFVQGANAHPANLAIIEAIVELAHNLGMKSVAEWAEDHATVESLAQLGVDYVQGFAISQPLLPSQILVAESSASFIKDAALAQYVRNTLASGQNLDLWDQFVGPVWNKMH